jgi:hypothetical protein
MALFDRIRKCYCLYRGIEVCGVRIRLNPEEYLILSDLRLPGKNDNPWIDILILSRFGIFVIVIKNLVGLIRGTEHDKEWILLYKKEYSTNR